MAEDRDGLRIVTRAAVEAAFPLETMLRQQPDGSTKLSVRSSPAFDACAICAKLGGGGHKAAAGASLPLPPDHAQAALLQAIYDVYPSLLPQ